MQYSKKLHLNCAKTLKKLRDGIGLCKKLLNARNKKDDMARYPYDKEKIFNPEALAFLPYVEYHFLGGNFRNSLYGAWTTRLHQGGTYHEEEEK